MATEVTAEGPPHSFLLWHGTRQGLEPTPTQAGEVRVIDSWLVDEGRVRALSAHAARFRASCAALAPALGNEVDAFFAALAEWLPERGRWFPRAELVWIDAAPRLRLWVRPAPARGLSVRLWVAPEPDQRVHPTIKGPDLPYLTQLRQAAVEQGADEALLQTASGHLLEGASSSLMWWREGDVLCTPPQAGVLPSVTQAILLDLAEAAGVTTDRSVSPQAAELADNEVWVVNALHGIRPVTAWVGTAVSAGAATRAESWHRRLDELAVPLCRHSAAAR
ncbi:aminotransferase class IV [Caldimonas brevitalea]|nr:aminotransferase class IV [Caldimonas brevitalea]